MQPAVYNSPEFLMPKFEYNLSVSPQKLGTVTDTSSYNTAKWFWLMMSPFENWKTKGQLRVTLITIPGKGNGWAYPVPGASSQVLHDVWLLGEPGNKARTKLKAYSSTNSAAD